MIIKVKQSVHTDEVIEMSIHVCIFGIIVTANPIIIYNVLVAKQKKKRKLIICTRKKKDNNCIILQVFASREMESDFPLTGELIVLERTFISPIIEGTYDLDLFREFLIFHVEFELDTLFVIRCDFVECFHVLLVSNRFSCWNATRCSADRYARAV